MKIKIWSTPHFELWN